MLAILRPTNAKENMLFPTFEDSMRWYQRVLDILASLLGIFLAAFSMF